MLIDQAKQLAEDSLSDSNFKLEGWGLLIVGSNPEEFVESYTTHKGKLIAYKRTTISQFAMKFNTQSQAMSRVRKFRKSNIMAVPRWIYQEGGH